MLRRTAISALMVLALGSVASAQFGGGPGDVVIYTLTYNGSADFQFPSLGTANTAADLASFHKIVLNAVPIIGSAPFSLQRQILFTNSKETFQVGIDAENTVGKHRLFLFPLKMLEIAGVNQVVPGVPGASGLQSEFISWPDGIDVEDDVAYNNLLFTGWFPGQWPFIALTNTRGSVGPPNISGFQYLLETPGLVTLPALLPWTNMSALYPTAKWRPGTDLKLLETDKTVGSTAREMRLRAGAQTPLFNTAGHNHMFILQGSVTITPAGGTPIVMNQFDYAYLPEGFTVSLANPAQYTGPVVTR